MEIYLAHQHVWFEKLWMSESQEKNHVITFIWFVLEAFCTMILIQQVSSYWEIYKSWKYSLDMKNQTIECLYIQFLVLNTGM